MATVCANCGITIRWQPTTVRGKTFCCVGCSRGGPCSCDYGNLPIAPERSKHSRGVRVQAVRKGRS